MTTPVELPALDGRLPLGFLAALGLLRLLEDSLPGPVSLSFTPEHGSAVIHSNLETITDVTSHLTATVADIGDGVVIPGLTPGFPRYGGNKSDPMRPPREAHHQFTCDVIGDDQEAGVRWLPCLVTDLAADVKGRAAITPFMAPRGQQKMRSFFEESIVRVKGRPQYLAEALSGWRRVPGFTGEYLDHAALNAPVDDPAGRTGQERGVPGATWLATMAIPMLRLTGNGRDRSATLWHRIGQRNYMIWPLWHQPLDMFATQVLMEHPALRPLSPGPTVSSAHWETLGISAVHGAERRRLLGIKDFEGVLMPVHVKTAA